MESVEIRDGLPPIHAGKDAICIIENGIEFGLYSMAGEPLKGTGKRKYGTIEYEPTKSVCMDKIEIVEEIREPIVFLGHIRNHYGHFLIDAMSKLWPIFNDNSSKKYAIYLPGSARFIETIFQYIGLNESNTIFITATTLLHDYEIPDLSYKPGEYIYKEYHKTFQDVANLVCGSTNLKEDTRLYLSRSKFSKEGKVHEFGERAIESMLSDVGYNIIYPEKMDIVDQIVKYQSAKIFVSPNGTISHNVLWCKPGVKQVVINRFDDNNFHVRPITDIVDGEFKEIDVGIKEASHFCSCFLINGAFCHFFGINISKWKKGVYNGLSLLKYNFWKTLRGIYYSIKQFK